MRRKNTTMVRNYPETKAIKQKLARELTFIEGKDIKLPELDRRVFNIPNLPNILREDAKLKRKLKF